MPCIRADDGGRDDDGDEAGADDVDEADEEADDDDDSKRAAKVKAKRRGPEEQVRVSLTGSQANRLAARVRQERAHAHTHKQTCIRTRSHKLVECTRSL